MRWNIKSNEEMRLDDIWYNEIQWDEITLDKRKYDEKR